MLLYNYVKQPSTSRFASVRVTKNTTPFLKESHNLTTPTPLHLLHTVNNRQLKMNSPFLYKMIESNSPMILRWPVALTYTHFQNSISPISAGILQSINSVSCFVSLSGYLCLHLSLCFSLSLSMYVSRSVVA